MDFSHANKNTRILHLYTLLMQGKVLYKHALAEEFCISEKTIQRDIDDLRDYLSTCGDEKTLVYSKKRTGYLLTTGKNLALTNSEVLAVTKILLESRSMVRDELFPILDKIVCNCTPRDGLKRMQDLLANEKFHYVEPHHGKLFVDKLWILGTAIQEQSVIDVTYHRTHQQKDVHRVLHPVGILFSEYYFYLAAFIEGIDKDKHFKNPQDKAPTIYRIDQIEAISVTRKHFPVLYKDRFQEGEMRKRIQFMYGGDLQCIKFKYTGPSVEAVLDRLPTARIVEQTPSGWVISAEVFGRGIDMWLRSQGDKIKML
ncbi:MAG: WYL domain-containing transcriptional regulator [Ruthenibacterium sp.]